MRVSLTMPDLTLSGLDERSRPETCEVLLPMDESAFRAFYERTARPLRVYLGRIAPPELADDLLQEAYYRFYRASAAYEDEKHRRNALFQIATNLVRDNFRRRRNRHDVPLPSDDERDSLASDDRTASRVEGRADLQKAMARLTPSQRQMLWLAYALGVSHAEIAEIVGVKSGSVKLLLFRAKRKVAKLLREAGIKGGSRG